MSAPLFSTHRQLELLRELQRLANERAAAETRLADELAQELERAESDRQARTREINQQFESARLAAQTAHERARIAAEEQYERQRQETQSEYQQYRTTVEQEHQETTRTALARQQDASWEAWTLFEAQKDKPRENLAQALAQLKQRREQLAVLERDAVSILQLRRMGAAASALRNGEPRPGEVAVSSALPDAATDATAASDNASPAAVGGPATAESVDQLLSAVREQTLALYHQRLPRLYEGGNAVGLLLLLWVLVAIALGLVLGWTDWRTYAISGGAAVLVTAGVLAWLYPVAVRRSAGQFSLVRELIDQTRSALHRAVDTAKRRSRQEASELLTHRDAVLARANEEFRSVTSAKDEWKSAELGAAMQRFPARLSALRRQHDEALASAEDGLRRELAEITATRDEALSENQSAFEDRCRTAQTEYDDQWQAMASAWHTGLRDVRDGFQAMRDQCTRLFPDWSVTDYGPWQPPETAPGAIKFGDLTLDVTQIKHGRPANSQLMPDEPLFVLPALMTLAEHPLMVIDAAGPGRERAVELLELMTLRLLTAMPAGKIRLTILDPVGLGENFASFMHLADFDERLIASRIWTESKHINEQLVRLTTHMETVLQKYLRNEFATIHEYNAYAGEVAEPFQILIVANFPANFSEETARRLVSIATSGPRCGVYTLMSIDRQQRLPNDFRRDDLLASAVHLDWQPEASRFVWRYPALEHLPLAVDRSPPAERFNEVVRAAGRAAKQAIRVEVPFSAVAPEEDELWTESTANELVVPVGRAGATRLQPVRLGKGTSQHLLVCGKTGSGKSTFLHALITNSALMYSPEELEFYLIDFKKGVEFKCYATANLPHARVIAIESEREFGLSVLEKLDEELRRRGDLFRALGVQDLPAFRAARPDEPMPRVLLIIDEFQELFVEDDKLAQDAGLLLDRLVRQGRAFGMHVLLGSQTLSGAYSLARSTMGQMAVRVALQCSDADAHLILNDERNPAARYLSRPGEAIYNDQNGLLTGNSPFQVVWLPEQERLAHLRTVGHLQDESGSEVPLPIVFEGNAPADPATNRQLMAALENGARFTSGSGKLVQHEAERAAATKEVSPAALEMSDGAQKAWLGAAVAIKEPTSATFARHAGSNLLVVGHREESAIGVLSAAVISLAAQQCGRRNAECGSEDPNSESTSPISHSAVLAPQFFILDGTRPESPEAGTWQRVAEALDGCVSVHGLRDTADVVGKVAAELARREEAGAEQPPPLYLVIYNGGRFRELRRAEDDFSFSMDRDKPPSPDKQLAEILKNGPAWGIHTLVWCDSYNNVTRLFDRMTLREFEMRVVFQMSAADSTSLLDSPAAAKLVVHRGLFYSDETGTAEKFRPYGPPTGQWLERVQRALAKV